MLLLDGIEYTVKTPDENVDDLVTFINDRCQTKQIKNSLGEIIKIDANEANPMYQLCYGAAYLTTILQKLVYNAGCSLSIPEASDRQLLNLADVAGVKRVAATKTIIQGIVYADITGTGAQPCTITRQDVVTVTIAGIDIVFTPAYDVSVPINEAKQIIFVADKEGSFNIAANTITAFDRPIPGLRKLETSASVPGSSEEPIAALRARMQRRGISGTQADRAAEAIQELPGISLCNIYFNYSPSEHETIGTRHIDVPPRTALIYAQGANEDVAKVFYRYMICDTAGKDQQDAILSTYTTRAGQELSVAYFPPIQVPAYIRVAVRNELSSERILGIKDAVASLASMIRIGQPLTSVMVADVIQKSFPTLEVIGVDLSTDGTRYTLEITPESDSLFIFQLDKIKVEVSE